MQALKLKRKLSISTQKKTRVGDCTGTTYSKKYRTYDGRTNISNYKKGGREGRDAGMKEFIRDLVTGFLIGLATGAGIIIVVLVYCRIAGPIF